MPPPVTEGGSANARYQRRRQANAAEAGARASVTVNHLSSEASSAAGVSHTSDLKPFEVRSREVTLKQKQDLFSNTHVTRPPSGEDSTRLRHRHTLGVLHIRKRIGAPLQHGRHGQPVLKRWRRCRRRGVCVELDRLARRHQLIARRAPCTAAPAQMHAVDCPTKQKCGADDVNVFGRGHEPRHRGRGRWRSD